MLNFGGDVIPYMISLSLYLDVHTFKNFHNQVQGWTFIFMRIQKVKVETKLRIFFFCFGNFL